MPPSPQDVLNIDAGWEDWRIEEAESQIWQQSRPRSQSEVKVVDSPKIIEAQSWYLAPNGKIILSARSIKSVARSASFPIFNCQLLNRSQP